MATTPTQSASKESWLNRRMSPIIAGAAVLVVIAGAAFYYASKAARHKAAANVVTIKINAGACEPNEISTPAGRTTFEIVNASDRVVEWEILDGVMVLEERENIAPGISSLLTAKLAPGIYDITCGLLSNPRGKLTVTPSAESSAEAAHPPLASFIGPLAEYQVYLVLESADLIDAAQELNDAIKAGDVARAKSLYEPARAPYLHVAPVAERLGDLDATINANADYFEKREQDPAFSGFHRIEYGLFAQNSTEGLGPVADKLVSDAAALKERLHGLKLKPEDLAGGAATRIAKVADIAAAGGDNRYAGADPAEIEANLAGAAKVVDLLRPHAAKAAPDLLTHIDAAFAASRTSLAALKGEGGGPDAARQTAARDLRELAAQIGKLNAAIGLD